MIGSSYEHSCLINQCSHDKCMRELIFGLDDFDCLVMRFFFLSLSLSSGSKAAGATGCQHPGGEDGEQDADGGERPWHGQHHLSELHGLPGGDGEGKRLLLCVKMQPAAV